MIMLISTMTTNVLLNYCGQLLLSHSFLHRSCLFADLSALLAKSMDDDDVGVVYFIRLNRDHSDSFFVVVVSF